MADVTLRLRTAEGEQREETLAVDRVVNCGYTGRDEAAVREHVEELEAEGIPAPETVPACYPKPSHLLTQRDRIEVVGDRTSGEAEFVLVAIEGETLVAVGSDHTDRAIERESIPWSKLVCPNVVSTGAWRLSTVLDHWDELRLRSWTGRDGERIDYQNASVDRILQPDELFELVEGRARTPLAGTAIFSGSVATLTDELVCGDYFEVELHDPVLDRRLTCRYDVEPVDWLVT